MPVTADAIARWPLPRPGRQWLVGPLLVLVGLPLLMLAASWLAPQPDTWAHLSRYLLPQLVGNTVVMLVVVGLGTSLVGVSLAWLSACCEYPLRRLLDPLLVLPLAFPTYVLAFIYLGVFDYAGPVQGLTREVFGATPAALAWPAGPAGVLLVLVLAFYPYVYLLTRAAFIGGGLAAFEAGRSLGAGPLATFFRVSLPVARPALAAGLALALMETLADFGAVSIYGFETFTTAIYKTWFGLFNLTAAVQLASILMLFVLLLVTAERFSRGRGSGQGEQRPSGHRIRLTGLRAWLATAAQAAVIVAGVIVPLVQLLVWAGPRLSSALDDSLVQVITNTMLLGGVGAVTVVAGGMMLLASGWRAGRRQQLLGEFAALGYAIPGTVLAVAIMLALIRLDQSLGSALAGGLLGLVLAYLIRFVRVAWGPLDGVAHNIRPQYVEVARSLGVSRWQRWRRINLPLIWPGLVTAFLLALVEIAKEMPATLMLRPFGWETLAVRIYELTAEGQWQPAALPALVLVVLGAIPVVVLIRRAAVPR